MNAVGLITEYNPFHNGHLHHLRESLRLAGAEISVAVMSGHFLQRGEAALADKWLRARTALAAGVDLVVEIPFPFACNSAPHFASGALRLLDALGASSLCFGSEAGELAPLQEAAGHLERDKERIEAQIRRRLCLGESYPAARAGVLATEGLGEGAVAALRSPNNILGIEYLRAIAANGSNIRPLAIPRIGSGYHEQRESEGIASATGIRARIAEGRPWEHLLPRQGATLLAQALERGLGAQKERFFSALMGRLLPGEEALCGLYQADGGSLRRLCNAALEAVSVDDLVERAAQKQLTRTRIRRMLVYALLGVKSEMGGYLECGPLYLRLLGASKRGEAYLGKRRDSLGLPLIHQMPKAKKALRRFYGEDGKCRQAAEMLALDCRATRLYSLLMPGFSKHRNRDFFEEVIRGG